MSEWPFGDLVPLRYDVVYADCPWLFRRWSEKPNAKAPQAHYQCMTIDEIAALPVGQLAGPDSLLFSWATAPMLPDAISVMRRWGFEYVTAGAWAKQSSTGRAWAFGTGYALRSAAEFFLIGKIGQPKLYSKSVRNLIVAPVREHSRKPTSAYEMIEALIPNGRYCELFARCERPGWDSWGDQVGKFEVAA